MELILLSHPLAVCRLEQDAALPDWALGSVFFSVTRTDEELSVVALESDVPPTVRCERGWRCLKVAGPLDFSQTGVLSSIAGPLAPAGISIFAVSTYDTDYVFVKESQLLKAVQILIDAGHTVAG